MKYCIRKNGHLQRLTRNFSCVLPLIFFSGTCACATENEPIGVGGMVSNLAAANTMFLFSLHDRLGEAQFTDALSRKNEVTSLWLRQTGGHTSWRDTHRQVKTQENRYTAQIGGDIARWTSNGRDRWHVGFMGGYGNMHSHTDSRVAGQGARGSVEGYSVGTYLTGFANDETYSGAWFDGWLMYSWFNNKAGEVISSETYKSHGITASLEGGYVWRLGETIGSKGSHNQWFIQPHAQIIWMGVRADDVMANNGDNVQGKGDGNWQSRVGLRLWAKGHHARDDKKNREFQPFMELNWIHNTDDFGSQINDRTLYQDGTQNIGEIVVGLEGQLNKRLHIWGNVGIKIGDASYNDTSANLGIKYLF